MFNPDAFILQDLSLWSLHEATNSSHAGHVAMLPCLQVVISIGFIIWAVLVLQVGASMLGMAMAAMARIFVGQMMKNLWTHQVKFGLSVGTCWTSNLAGPCDKASSFAVLRQSSAKRWNEMKMISENETSPVKPCQAMSIQIIHTHGESTSIRVLFFVFWMDKMTVFDTCLTYFEWFLDGFWWFFCWLFMEKWGRLWGAKYLPRRSQPEQRDGGCNEFILRTRHTRQTRSTVGYV